MTTTINNQEDIMSGTTRLTTPSDREIFSERIFAAPREHVFAAYTDPDSIPRLVGTPTDDHGRRPHGPAPRRTSANTLTVTSLFHTTEERDGMLASG